MHLGGLGAGIVVWAVWLLDAPVEIESFAHGSLCICYSGQCLMSSLIGGRSATAASANA